ncbi:MAG: NAD(P)H:quinone oxidoreductase [Dehalococcoidia bacterium]
MSKVAVIYYSATGNVYRLAEAIAEGATEAGAEVRLRRIPELAAAGVIAANKKWQAHVEAAAAVPEAGLDDLEWADAAVFGSPTRFGNISAALKHYIDQCGGLWAQGKLAGKVVSGFTSASTAHGGLESTLLALYNTFYSWGCIIVPPGYADPIQMQSGNPYGASFVARSGTVPGEVELAAARFQGKRTAQIAAKLAH